MNNKNKKLENIIAISYCALFLSTIIGSIHPNIGINFAIINFISSIFPSIYIISNPYKSKIIKKKILILFSLVFLQIITFILNYTVNNNSGNLTDFINIVSFTINLIGFFYLLDNKIDKNDIIKKAAKVIIIFTFIFCIHNLITNYSHIHQLISSKYASSISFSSFYANRNNFAELLFLAIIILFYLKHKKQINSFIFAILVSIFISNLIMTLSRAGIVSSLLFITTYYFLNGTKQKIKILSIIFLITTLIYSFGAQSFINNSIVRENAGDSGRSEIWKEAINLTLQKPLFGYGDNNMSTKLRASANNGYAHNIFVGTLLSRGVIYTTIYIAFICSYVKETLKKSPKSIKGFIIASFVSTLFYGLFESYYYFNFGLFNMLFTTIIFIIPTINRQSKGEKNG